jgi:hypothetical protein
VTPLGGRRQQLLVLSLAGLALVVAATVAVEIFGDLAVGALLGVLVALGLVGLRQQVRYARSNSAAIASVDRRVTKLAQQSTGQAKRITALTQDVNAWADGVRKAEIETGIAALNRYVALGSDDSIDRA